MAALRRTPSSINGEQLSGQAGKQASGVMGKPQPAMASLLLVWVLLLLSPSSQEATPKGPREPQLRYPYGTWESASSWVATVALLSGICATWIFAFHALRCLSVKQEDLCAREPEAECEALGKQAYAHQLASTEEQLESFLHEVWGRRCALGDILLDEQYLANLKRDSKRRCKRKLK
ncbi:uncharacterized protein LOC144584853 [Pogona vitticeps]